MTRQSLVSIIIPVYNVSLFLRKSLDSVINQTYKNVEIIIIDDGSNDGSALICDEYANKDQHIRLVHQNNQGLSAARNVGLDLAAGDFIAFLDPDDEYHPEIIKTMLMEITNTSSDLVICMYADGKSLFPLMEEGIYGREAVLIALAENRINNSVWNKLYKRTLFEKIRFPNGHVYEDVDVMFRILDACNKVSMINKPLYYHRSRPGSITNTVSEKNTRDWCLAYKHYKLFIKKHIPDLFTEKHLKGICESELRTMISFYSMYPPDEAQSFKRRLRRRIIMAGKHTDLRSIRTQAALWMIRFCPGLLRIIYPVYRPIRLLFFRIAGR